VFHSLASPHRVLSLLGQIEAKGSIGSVIGTTRDILSWALTVHPGLEFGTASIRAPMGAGSCYINSLTIIQTSQGPADYLLGNVRNAADAGVVVGCDMREHSARFARLTAAAFIAKGFTVKCFELYVHTPMVPFAVDYFKAAAGVMITASHNPKEHNGYIVYGPDACQINAPVDGMIRLSILKNLEPITWNVEAALASPPTQYVLGIILTAYRSKARQFLGSLTAGKVPAFLYTPLHGVGLGYLDLVLHSPQADFEDRTVDVVPEQAAPDLTFPTVKYPNPEEVEALDHAKATAKKKQPRLIFANDPDAGGFAVAEKVGDHWFDFTGDQIGVLLAHYLMTKFPPKPTVPCFLLASAVSSQLLSHVAPDMGFHYAETLTGCK